MRRVFLASLVALSLAAGQAGCADESASAPKFKLGMFVKATDIAYGCVTREKLTASLQHSVRGEKDAFRAMFTSFDCIEIPPGLQFKVLTAERNIIEITNAKNSDVSGVWASSDSFSAAK